MQQLSFKNRIASNPKIENYIDKPFDQNQDQVNNIQEIAAEHQVTNYLAALLYHSKA